ncbi:hypothetical protein JCM10212_002405 [Sporobolomyces blumeae]
MASRTATPQPWPAGNAQAGASSTAGGGGAATSGGGLQLPQSKATGGKAPATSANRAASAEPKDKDGGEPASNAKSTDVDSLMDAVGASGVDLGAEEESLRASNERAHAAAMAAAAASSSGTQGGAHAYTGLDRSRKQDFIDPQVLAECVKKVAAAFQLKTLEPDTIPLIALATRHRLQSLVNASIAARDHRQASSHFRPPPFVPAPSTSSNKRRRRNPMDGEVDEDEDDEDEDEDDEMDTDGELGSEARSKRPKVPAWDALIYDDPERYLSVLERVDREEERKKRRERMMRDQKEQEERELAQALADAEAARKALEEQGGDATKIGEGLSAGGGGEGSAADKSGDKSDPSKGKGKAKGGAERFLAANNPDSAPSTPTKELGKDGKPKKKKKAKTAAEGGGGGGGGGGTPAPSGTSTPSAASVAKNMSEDAKKRMTDNSAMRSLGGAKYSWMNAGPMGSPSPASAAFGGTPGGLPRPKFAPASSLSQMSNFATTSTSNLNPANSAPISATGSGQNAAANALMTSRLNIPPLHDAQRTQIAKDRWEAGHHVVELHDLLFALDRERGVGVGKGAGRGAAVRGRAGITRGGYRGAK